MKTVTLHGEPRESVPRNFVISAATGYSAGVLEPFLSSLYACAPFVGVVLVVDVFDEGFEQELRALHPNVLLAKVNRRTWVDRLSRFRRIGKAIRLLVNVIMRLPGFVRQPFVRGVSRLLFNGEDEWNKLRMMHIAVARFFYFRDVIDELGTHVDQVVLADSRDTIFQSDPFSHIDSDLICGLEAGIIRDSRPNREWIDLPAGADGLSLIGELPIVNLGVMLGTRTAVQEYVELLCSKYLEQPLKCAFRPLDQGIHNWLVHVEGYPVNVVLSDSALISTLGLAAGDSFILDPERGVQTQSSELIAIVHQYDWHPSLKDWVQLRWSHQTG